MPALVAGIHVLLSSMLQRRGLTGHRPVHRKLEVRRGADAEAQHVDVPVLGRLDIFGLEPEVFYVIEGHLDPPLGRSSAGPTPAMLRAMLGQFLPPDGRCSNGQRGGMS